MKANLLERFDSDLASTDAKRENPRPDAEQYRRIMYHMDATDISDALIRRHGFEEEDFSVHADGSGRVVRQAAVNRFVKKLEEFENLDFDRSLSKKQMLIWLVECPESPVENYMTDSRKSNLRRDGLAAMLRYLEVNDF